MMRNLGAWLIILLLLTSCDQQNKALQAEDDSNPNIHQAIAAEQDRDYPSAAKYYEAALSDCPTLAQPHFELGLLYADRLNDPISAMYHFQAYLKLRPNAENREGAEKRLESLKIQFAASVPNSPIDNAEAWQKLEANNQSLVNDLQEARQKLAELTSGAKPDSSATTTPVTPSPVKDTPDSTASTAATENPAPAPASAPNSAVPSGSTAPTASTPSSLPVTSSTAAPTPASPTDAGSPVISTTAPPIPTPSNPSTETPAPATPTTSAATPTTPAAPSADSGDIASTPERTYTVAQGDTLWSISKKFYPGQINNGIDKIKKANTAKLPDGKPLRIGTVLVIP